MDAPGEGGFRRCGHICAYQRGYYDAIERRKKDGESEKRGHRSAYEKGWIDGKAEIKRVTP